MEIFFLGCLGGWVGLAKASHDIIQRCLVEMFMDTLNVYYSLAMRYSISPSREKDNGIAE